MSRLSAIDDAATTEIDDALSVVRLPGGSWRVGIHIAAPALGFPPGSELDNVALRRLSTVYMPGRKITMLPDEVVECFTLNEGTANPALSMYSKCRRIMRFSPQKAVWSACTLPPTCATIPGAGVQ